MLDYGSIIKSDMFDHYVDIICLSTSPIDWPTYWPYDMSQGTVGCKNLANNPPFGHEI